MVAGLRQLSDDVFLVAAHRLADLVTPDRLRQGALYPPISELRSIARSVAISVVEHARACDPVGWEWEPGAAAVERAMWWPDYVPTVPG